MKRVALMFALALAAASPAAAQPTPQPALDQRVAAALAEAPTGTRFGLVVTDETGRELVAINPDGRFIPASNTKLLTTAAAYATLTGLDRPDAAAGATVSLDPIHNSDPDVILRGRGDARLSSAADCTVNCLAALADAVAARTRRVRYVIGDARLFPNEPWSPGMSWNNIPTRSGTGVAALVVDDNEAVLEVAPGRVGHPPVIDRRGYFLIENRATTVADGATSLDYHRMPGSNQITLTGTIAATASPVTLRFGIDYPESYAAWRLKRMLEERGVRVEGHSMRLRQFAGGVIDPAVLAATTRLRLDELDDDVEQLAQLTPPPLAEDIVRINKESQNLHSELLLRRIGLARGDGSIAGGIAGVEAMMAQAGVPRTAWDISDGSGMSTYNRIAPRAMVRLLRWAQTQPWGAAWRAGFPIAGVDGTLSRRFRGTPLEGRLFAKTGTINATNALSGYLVAASGRTLTFSFFANDMPGGASATAKMDEVLNLIAAAN